MTPQVRELTEQLSVARATIAALLSGQIDAVIDSQTQTPLLLSKAQAALKESEERYRQIVEATSDGIGKVDMEGRIVFANQRLAEMLGYQPSELLGIAAASLTIIKAADSASDLGLSSSADTIETNCRHRNGSEVAVSIHFCRLFDEAGKVIGYLGMVRDVTERSRLMSQLVVSDRMASVGTLAAGVAHEINNPLAAVIANLDCIAEAVSAALVVKPSEAIMGPASKAWLVDEIRTPLNDALEGADRVRFIVRDLRIFARSPDDDLKGPVDVRAVMESSLRMGWNEIRHRARLVKRYSPVSAVAANEARLGQVFLNLLVNAAQALPIGNAEQNEIRVSIAGGSGGRVVVEVSDTGPGIPPEIIGRIFDAFFTTKAAGVGTGLGLAICQRIVTDLGGELTVRSELGHGSTFTVALPLAVDEPAVSASVVMNQVPGRRGQILVVDDDMVVLRSINRVLGRDHQVTTTASAKEALGFCLAGNTFDLLLCDLMMPDMSGIDLHHELSRLIPLQAEKMLFLTGGAFTEKERQFLSDVPREHLEKPYSAANLRAVVRRYVQ
jgi:PAS domain S-box-containing protein